MSGPLRVGLIGYGLAGRSFHSPFIATTEGLELTHIVTTNPDRVAHARKDHPGATVVDTPEKLWTEGLDLVVVASPNRTHVALAIAALKAGSHVVVDKPVAAKASEAKHLARTAKELGRGLVPFHIRRWDGDFHTVRRMIEENALGEVFRFESRFDRWRPVPAAGWRDRPDPEEAGGLLYDLGPHLIDQALHLFGPVDSVYAELDLRRPGVEVDDDAFVALHHRSGVRSHLWMSSVVAKAGPRLRILGSAAAFVKYGMDVQEPALRRGVRPDQEGFGIEPEDHWGFLGVGDAMSRIPTTRGNYAAFYQGVRDMIRSGAPPPVDPDDAVAGLGIIEAAFRSAEGKGPVSI